jgi:hypothetical protein
LFLMLDPPFLIQWYETQSNIVIFNFKIKLADREGIASRRTFF